MNKQYYVQEIAGNYLKNIVDDPAVMKIDPVYLHGAEKEAFQQGYTALLALARSLYADIARDPASFGMLLKEYVEPDAKNTDYTNSNNSFLRVPNLLLAIGLSGECQPDISLAIDGCIFLATTKELKITNMPVLLGKLREYGFEIDGFGKTVKAGDKLHVSYPDSRHLVFALKSMADAMLQLNKGDIKKSKNYFYMLHGGLLESETVKAPKLTISSLCHALDSDRSQTAQFLHEAVAASSKAAIKMGGFMRNDWSCVYTGTKNKRVLMTLHVNQDKLSAKLNLQHIGQYIDKITDYPEAVRDTIRNSGWECGHCQSGCSGGFAFEMEAQAYNKCRCGSFLFEDVSADTSAYCKQLLTLELEN